MKRAAEAEEAVCGSERVSRIQQADLTRPSTATARARDGPTSREHATIPRRRSNVDFIRSWVDSRDGSGDTMDESYSRKALSNREGINAGNSPLSVFFNKDNKSTFFTPPAEPNGNERISYSLVPHRSKCLKRFVFISSSHVTRSTQTSNPNSSLRSSVNRPHSNNNRNR